ncbi:MAG: fumarylacetoacetate hydrolase family protein [Chloroflexi bacterium]|nr:fumarylacetoacetate hydrolase family protein [Chloroflexota bacterium]
MKLVRYLFQGEVAYGVIEGQDVRRLAGDPFAEYRLAAEVHGLSAVRLLAPCTPTKAVAMALNYHSHLGGRPAPTRPQPFLKAPNCIIGPSDPIILPKDAGRVDAEGELVVVLSKRCKNVTPGKALDYVLGYTCGNDVSAREWQMGQDRDIQWWRAKSADTFGPIGPMIVTDFSPEGFELRTRINSEEAQRGNASDLIFDIPTIVSFISQVVTLEPGDVIFTGTPGTTRALRTGDVVEVEVVGLGVLQNPVQVER